MHNTHALQPKPRSWVIIDIESAVTDESGHRRYMAMERWAPAPGKPSRRSCERSADPLQTPRWPFQTIVAAAIMILVEHDDGNVDVASFTTLSAPELDEKGVMTGIVDALAAAADAVEEAAVETTEAIEQVAAESAVAPTATETTGEGKAES